MHSRLCASLPLKDPTDPKNAQAWSRSLLPPHVVSWLLLAFVRSGDPWLLPVEVVALTDDISDDNPIERTISQHPPPARARYLVCRCVFQGNIGLQHDPGSSGRPHWSLCKSGKGETCASLGELRYINEKPGCSSRTFSGGSGVDDPAGDLTAWLRWIGFQT
jgi:hypothetical protein